MNSYSVGRALGILCAVSLLSVSSHATIRSSANYKIESDGISAAQQMSSSNYQLFSVAGDTRILGESTSSNFSLGAGTIYVINAGFGGLDTDGDGIPDISDPDDDNDGIPDTVELTLGLDPLSLDTDGNGISDANEDFDGDGYSNLAEVVLGSDPANISDVPTDSYVDVDSTHPLYLAVEVLARAGIVEGCAIGNFCPDAVMTREGISKWLLRAINDSAYVPPTAASSGYIDIDIGDPAVFEDGDFASDWIEQYRAEGITEGCNIDNTEYCPKNVVTRSAAAKILLRASSGSAYLPPTATSNPYADVDIGDPAVFGDGDFASDWIAEFTALDLTNGCDGDDLGDGLNYCPNQVMTKAEFANLLMRTFEITP